MTKLGKSHIGISSDTAVVNIPYISGPYTAFENGTVDSISLHVLTTGIDVQFGLYLLGEQQFTVSFSGGSGTAPAIGDTVTWTGGSGIIGATPTGNASTGTFIIRGTPDIPLNVSHSIAIPTKGWSASTVSSVVTIVGSPTRLIAKTAYAQITEAGWKTIQVLAASGVRNNQITQGSRYFIAFTGKPTTGFTPVRAEWLWSRNLPEEKWWINGSLSGGELIDTWLTGGGSTYLREASAYIDYTPAIHDPDDNTLQGRINRANPGDTILVRQRDLVYNERIMINKPLKLVGQRNRRTGKFPIIQGGVRLTGWTLSTAPEHVDKNVWYKDISIRQDGTLATLSEHGGVRPTWVRSLQLDDRGIQVLQYHPLLAGEGANESQATQVRNHVLTCNWSSPGYFLVAGETIDFWEWYDAIACHENINSSTGRLWLRLNNNNPSNLIVNPNSHQCYATFTMNTQSTNNEDWNRTNELSNVIQIENTDGVLIKNLEIRGGRWGINCRNSKNIVIEDCSILVPALRSIYITDCENVLIQRSEITSKRMRRNMVPGFAGTSVKANAAKFGWSLNKNYSTNGSPSPAGSSVTLSGVTSNVNIKRNLIESQGGGIDCNRGNDTYATDVVIENNTFRNTDSSVIVIYPRTLAIIRNNIFHEVMMAFRVQDMMNTMASERWAIIEGNYFHTEANTLNDEAGYLMQAHYAGVRYKMNFSGGSGTAPVEGDKIHLTGGIWGHPVTSPQYSWSRSGTTATFTQAIDHGLQTGDILQVVTTSDAAAIPLGNYVVTYITRNMFSITCQNTGSINGTIRYNPAVTLISTTGNSTSGSITRYYSDSHANTSATWTRSSTVATVTSNNHGLITGDILNVVVTGSSAAIPIGSYSVTVLDDNRFMITCLNAGSTNSTLSYYPFVRSAANLKTGWISNITSVESVYDWTTPVTFRNNFVRNIPAYTPNVIGYADVSMSNNIFDCKSGMSNVPHTLVENNWFGGNLGVVSGQSWFDSSNAYIYNQRLSGINNPGNFPSGVVFPQLTQKSGLKKHKKQSITIEVL